MKIACFAKYGFDPANLVIDRTKGTIDFERSPKKISEADVNGVEEAVKIKSSTPGSTVHIFTLAPSDALKPVRELVGMGADEGYLISDQSALNRDPFTIASILHVALKKFGPYDLILAGHASEDNYAGSVALMIAQMLGIPHIAYVQKLTTSPNEVTAESSMDGRSEIIKGRIPILLTVTRELNKPRYVTTLQLLRVPRDAVLSLKTDDLGLGPEAIAQLALQERVSLTPVSVSRKNIIIDGTNPVSASKQLISYLKSEKVI